MKKLIFSAFLLILTLGIFAQSYDLNSIYYNYKGKEGVVALRIPGFVMRLAGSIADLDREERQLLRSMKSIQVITIEDDNLNSRVNFVDEVDLDRLDNGYNLLMRVRDGEEDVAILAREKNGTVKDLVVLVGGDENVMVRIRGRMHSDMLESLFDVAGIEELKYTKEI